MKTYKEFKKLNELQLDLSVPIKDKDEIKILDIAKNDCRRYIKEFGRYNIILTLDIPAFDFDYNVISGNKLKIYKKIPPKLNDKYSKEYLKKHIDIDECIKFNINKASKIFFGKKNNYVIIPFGTFKWITLDVKADYEDFGNYDYKKIDNTRQLFGYSDRDKYLAINYKFYIKHWLNSKIMRPGMLSKLLY